MENTAGVRTELTWIGHGVIRRKNQNYGTSNFRITTWIRNARAANELGWGAG